MIDPKEIADRLTENRSKANVTRIIRDIELHGMDFHLFFQEVNNRPHPTNWYMTWLFSDFVKRNPREGAKAQHLIWQQLKQVENESMLRDLWRCLSFIQVNEELSGEIYDTAFQVIPSQKFAIAIRAHAMLTACNIAMPYPELRAELILVLDGLQEEESAGIRSRGRNLSKRLKRKR